MKPVELRMQLLSLFFAFPHLYWNLEKGKIFVKIDKSEEKAESVEKKEVKKSKAKKSKAKKSQAAKEVPSEGLQPEREVRATQSGSEVKTVVKSNNGSLTTAYIAVAVLMVIVAVLYAIYMKSYSQ